MQHKEATVMMEDIEKKEIYKEALSQWGENAQMVMAIEEMSELTKELAVRVNMRDYKYGNIIEEISDVEIMLEQLKEIFDCVKDVAYMKEEKLHRLSYILNGNDLETAKEAAREKMKGQTDADIRSGDNNSN